MTVKQQYQRARRNYLSRVRQLEKAGYVVERIVIPRKITLASIRRLNKQTTNVIRNRAPLIDVFTGEVIEVSGKTHRRKVEQKNVYNSKMISQINKELKKSQKPTTFSSIVERMPTSRDISIAQFYDSIPRFIPRLQPMITRAFEELLGNNTIEDRARVEKVLRENPDYIPTPMDSKEETIMYKFSELSRILRFTEEQQEQMMQIVSEEVEAE